MISAQIHGAKQLKIIHFGNMNHSKYFFIKLVFFKYLQIHGVIVI